MRRVLLVAMVCLGILAAGWLAAREAPAGHRVAETIKPYDPLQ